jgi:hypothetical protein
MKFSYKINFFFIKIYKYLKSIHIILKLYKLLDIIIKVSM